MAPTGSSTLILSKNITESTTITPAAAPKITALSGVTEAQGLSPERLTLHARNGDASVLASDVDVNDTLKVTNVNGQIEINAYDGDTVALEAVKKSRFGKEELDKVEIVVTESDNEIRIEAKPSFNARGKEDAQPCGKVIRPPGN